MMTMSKLDYDVGFGLGVRACRQQMHRVPAADKVLRSAIKEKGKNHCSVISLLQGWHDGYGYELSKRGKPKAQVNNFDDER